MKKVFKVLPVLLVALALIAFAQPVGKYLGFTADRFWDNNGIFKTDNTIWSYGVSNGLKLEYSPGVYNTDHIGLWIQDNSQSDVGTNYGLRLYTANYNQTRENAVWIGSQNGSWTNGISFYDAITNAFVFENRDMTNGASSDYGATAYDDQDAQAKGNIKVVIGGQTYYIYVYANAAHKN